MFYVQAGNPEFRTATIRSDSLGDAVEEVFIFPTESMVLFWNGCCFPLGYKYDMSLMVDDLLSLLQSVSGAGAGQASVEWPTNGYACAWDVGWAGSRLRVRCVPRTDFGVMKAFVDANPVVELTKTNFLSEFTRPLEIVRNAVSGRGGGAGVVAGLRRIEELLQQPMGLGYLYSGAVKQRT